MTILYFLDCRIKKYLIIHYTGRWALSYTDVLVTQQCLTLQSHELQPARLHCPWNSPDKNTGVGCHFLLQGIFATHEPNLGLLHFKQILYGLSHLGSPKLWWRNINRYNTKEKQLRNIFQNFRKHMSLTQQFHEFLLQIYTSKMAYFQDYLYTITCTSKTQG